ncbi:MAG: ECF transporter S component [Butyrivibrio sp.]|jgi:riboflavin transporter FmnP|uniref:ECF transporter S component n=1 Tax=Butyrivibrio sp. TaxID=28121 RepID=UPI001ECDA4E9|nr:ECF transporter S component [Butyrivibrio sp.]MBE5841907.1 ECF transporter S component [Butyrivibrio sp.]
MKEKQSLFSLITGNWQHFLALVVLMVIAFAVSIFAEKLASKKDLKEGKEPEKLLSIRKVSIIGVFSAIAFVLMLIEFPLPIAPSFYKFDFSDIPALVVGFAAGPFAGVMVEFIKVTLNILLQGTTSAFVGEIANFLIGASFVSVASIIYRFKKTRKNALIGCLAATLFITFAGAFLNAYFMIPAYALMFGGVENILSAGTAIYSFVDNVFTFCLFCVAPFNLVKGIVHSVITFLIYKQLSPILKAEAFGSAKKSKTVAANE